MQILWSFYPRDLAMIETIRNFLDTLSSRIFYWLSRHAEIVLVVICIIIMLEGVLLIIFPGTIREKIKKFPLIIYQILGGIFLVSGGIILYMYFRILQHL